jgi:hypothetical protein
MHFACICRDKTGFANVAIEGVGGVREITELNIIRKLLRK